MPLSHARLSYRLHSLSPPPALQPIILVSQLDKKDTSINEDKSRIFSSGIVAEYLTLASERTGVNQEFIFPVGESLVRPGERVVVWLADLPVPYRRSPGTTTSAKRRPTWSASSSTSWPGPSRLLIATSTTLRRSGSSAPSPRARSPRARSLTTPGPREAGGVPRLCRRRLRGLAQLSLGAS